MPRFPVSVLALALSGLEGKAFELVMVDSSGGAPYWSEVFEHKGSLAVRAFIQDLSEEHFAVHDLKQAVASPNDLPRIKQGMRTSLLRKTDGGYASILLNADPQAGYRFQEKGVFLLDMDDLANPVLGARIDTANRAPYFLDADGCFVRIALDSGRTRLEKRGLDGRVSWSAILDQRISVSHASGPISEPFTLRQARTSPNGFTYAVGDYGGDVAGMLILDGAGKVIGSRSYSMRSDSLFQYLPDFFDNVHFTPGNEVICIGGGGGTGSEYFTYMYKFSAQGDSLGFYKRRMSYPLETQYADVGRYFVVAKYDSWNRLRFFAFDHSMKLHYEDSLLTSDAVPPLFTLWYYNFAIIDDVFYAGIVYGKQDGPRRYMVWKSAIPADKIPVAVRRTGTQAVRGNRVKGRSLDALGRRGARDRGSIPPNSFILAP
jgi:hypothetical protein